MINIAATRCTLDGTPDDNGTYFKIVTNGSYETISPNHTLKLYTKLQSEDTYTLNKTITLSSPAFTDTEIIGTFSDHTYDVKAVVEDSYTSATMLTEIASSFHIIDARTDKTGIAFGKASENANTVEIVDDWELLVHGNAKVEGKLDGDLKLDQSTLDLYNTITGGNLTN